MGQDNNKNGQRHQETITNQAQVYSYTYMFYGLAVCVLFIYGINIGWIVIDPFAIVPNKPGGPGMHYHK